MKGMIKTLLVIIPFSGLMIISGCKKTRLATLTTAPASELTLVSARTGGNITDDGNADITARGVCWSATENPKVSDKKTSDGTGSGSFSSQLTGLTEGTVYYVRAYATNIEGTSYGNQISFTSVQAGTASVITKAVTEITLTTAISGGDITTDGGAPVTGKGICWGISENPTVTSRKTTEGDGVQSFTSRMTNLSEGTKYYVRAYVTNKAGTSYGNQVSFTTTTVTAPEVVTAPFSAISVNSAATGGTVKNDGGAPVTARGVVWAISANPTLSDNATQNGTGTGTFVSNLTGLLSGTIYYVRSYATNTVGTSYGPQLKFSTSITDVEGTVYKTVPIGNQLWMAENLKTTKYSDRSQIAFVPDSIQWMGLSTPAYCIYQNKTANKDKYGAIYNWYSVATGKLCPDGWHVPKNNEFETLELQVGVPADSIGTWGWRGNGTGTKLKDVTGWITGNGTNSSGFKAVPAGYRAWNNSQYRALGEITYFWSATDDAINNKPTVAWYRRLDGGDTRIFRATTEKKGGKSIRCLRNQ